MFDSLFLIDEQDILTNDGKGLGLRRLSLLEHEEKLNSKFSKQKKAPS